MVLKNCVICGAVYSTRNNQKTCGNECSKILHGQLTRRYYFEHSERWRWYKKNKKVDPIGTTGLVGKLKRGKDGKVDFGHEANLIAKEMRRIGLR